MEEVFYSKTTECSGVPEKREFSTAEAVISIVCFLLGLMFTHFVWNYAGGLWGGIFWFLVGVLGAIYVKIKKFSVTKPQIVVFGIAELFCFAPLFCTNNLINTLAAAFTFLLLFYLGITLNGAEVLGNNFIFDVVEAVCVQPFTHYSDGPVAAKGILKNKKAGKNIGYVLAGLALAVPLSVVVLYLLMQSDAMFRDSMEKVFHSMPSFEFSYVMEAVFAIFVWMYLFGAFSAFSVRSEKERLVDLQVCRKVPAALGYTAVTPVCVFYLLYIGVQFHYFTAAFGGNLPEEYSYSSYARQGFFELCVIAVINLGIIVLMQTFMKRSEEGKRPMVLKVYTTMIAAVTLLLIVSAISKMVLYIREMGMTPLRIYTSWFMLVLAILFILVIVAQFAALAFWKSAFSSFTIMLALLCFSNVDGMIADYNVTAYQEGRLESVDFGVLEGLGDASLVHIQRLTKDSDKEVAEEARELYEWMSGESDRKNDFAYFSIPRVIGRSGK